MGMQVRLRWRVPWPLCQRAVNDGGTAPTLLASLEQAVQPALVPKKLQPYSWPLAPRDPGALLLNTTSPSLLALPSQSRCSPCRPTAASACAVGEGWWPPFPAGSQGKDALPGRDRAARQPAARFGEERDRHGATCPERFITSSHSINATIRRWLGLEGHL